MTSKAFARIMARIDKGLVKAVGIALTEIEKEARKAIEASPATVQSFCMAMGRASFRVVWSEDWDGEPMPRDEHIYPGEFGKHGLSNPHAENIAKLLDEYNGLLRLTGYPMLIQRDEAGQLIKLKDW